MALGTLYVSILFFSLEVRRGNSFLFSSEMEDDRAALRELKIADLREQLREAQRTIAALKEKEKKESDDKEKEKSVDVAKVQREQFAV